MTAGKWSAVIYLVFKVLREMKTINDLPNLNIREVYGYADA